MAHNLPRHIQHHYSNRTRGTLLSTVQSAALALFKTETPLPDSLHRSDAFRLHRIPILRTRTRILDTRLLHFSPRSWLVRKTITSQPLPPSSAQHVLEKTCPAGFLCPASVLLSVLQYTHSACGRYNV